MFPIADGIPAVNVENDDQHQYDQGDHCYPCEQANQQEDRAKQFSKNRQCVGGGHPHLKWVGPIFTSLFKIHEFGPSVQKH